MRKFITVFVLAIIGLLVFVYLDHNSTKKSKSAAESKKKELPWEEQSEDPGEEIHIDNREAEKELEEGEPETIEKIKKKETDLVVLRAAICENIKDREPMGIGTEFHGKEHLYCYTEIEGVDEPTTVYHRWFYNDRMISNISLKVGASGWRTHSKKTVKGLKGDWTIQIVSGKTGNVLENVYFKVR